MKPRSAWRTTHTNWTQDKVDIYYTNEEYKAMKSLNYDMSPYTRVFIVTPFNFNSMRSSFFPPF